MPNKYLGAQRGFTVMEIVIYITLLALLMITIVRMLTIVVQSRGRLEAATEISSSALLVLGRIGLEVRAASTASISPEGYLVLEKNENGQEFTTEFVLDSQAIRLKENGVDLGPLTENSAKVTSVSYDIVVSGESRAVRTTLVLNNETFYLTTALRPR